MAQNVNPDNPQSSALAKQNDESVTIKDNHAVSKRLVVHFLTHSNYSNCCFMVEKSVLIHPS